MKSSLLSFPAAYVQGLGQLIQSAGRPFWENVLPELAALNCEINWIETQVNAPTGCWRDEHTLFARFISSASLTLARLVGSICDSRLIGVRVYSVIAIGFSQIFLKHSTDTGASLVSVKSVSREACQVAGMGGVVQLLGQIQKSCFM